MMEFNTHLSPLFCRLILWERIFLMKKFIVFINLIFSLNTLAQDGKGKGGIYLLTSEPKVYLKKQNSSNVTTFEKTITDKKRRLGLGVYGIGAGKFFTWEGGVSYMPYSLLDDPFAWRLSSNIVARFFNFLPFNVGVGFYYGFGSSKYSNTIFYSGYLASARLRLFGLFIEGKYLKDFGERKGSGTDSSLLYYSRVEEYQALIGFTSEGFFR